MGRFSSAGRALHAFLRSEKGKQVGGDALGRAADAADRATRGKHAGRIAKARDAAEKGLRRL